jgi:hypothetical protein
MLVFTELSGLPWPLRMKLHRILDLTDLSGLQDHALEMDDMS